MKVAIEETVDLLQLRLCRFDALTIMDISLDLGRFPVYQDVGFAGVFEALFRNLKLPLGASDASRSILAPESIRQRRAERRPKHTYDDLAFGWADKTLLKMLGRKQRLMLPKHGPDIHVVLEFRSKPGNNLQCYLALGSQVRWR
jgi:hypothetical protein